METTVLRRFNMPFSAKEKFNALNLLKYASMIYVARRYHCTVQSLCRWKKLFDGTLESLENKSHRPLSIHPNSQTNDEKKHIDDLVRRNPNAGLNELYGKLRLNYGYTRNPTTLYKYLKRKGFYEKKRKYVKYVPKPYDTPEEIGVKMQLDVKHVPRLCYVGDYPEERKFYQYTIIDEATRERFIYPYQELTANNTIDFLKRAFVYFGYTPKILQTDNGSEFTYAKPCHKKKHLLTLFCNKYKIEHRTIKPRTPRHNGKVERSHRNDNERFYSRLKFYSLDDLLVQMKAYLQRSNNIPVSTLKSKDKKTSWLTPIQKRKELLLLNWGVIE